ncbi:MAG: ATP-binding protein [Psychroflexus halocasei]
MIPRKAQQELVNLAAIFKTVAVIGPRQSGKTTLVRHLFSEKPYANLENPDTRQFAKEDPRGFLENYPNGAVFDEVQRVPELFSYLQEILDDQQQNGNYILTGSNNFLLQENISQSLAGRVGYLELLPLSLQEIDTSNKTADELLLAGGYPSIYQQNLPPSKWYANYIRTYVERDVRQIKNIGNLQKFEKFLRLCAGRVGQLLNMSSLSVEVGVDVKTIDSWLSILETSFVVFRLQPFHKNYNKRIVKMPKLYFYDVGLACALIGIENTNQLQLHPFRGALFENLVILEALKQRLNAGKPAHLSFWRDNVGHEIDLLINTPSALIPIEIKSGKTITSEYFKGLKFWNKITETEGGKIVYNGDIVQKRSKGFEIIPLKKFDLEAL